MSTTVPGATTVPLRLRIPIAGFGEIAFRPFSLTGIPLADALWCALLADTDAARVQGLQARTDLSGYDAMLFRFSADTTTPFTNNNTQIPLSLAWFASDGRFLGSVDMAACPAGGACGNYAAPGPYRYAIEVPQGRLFTLGLVAGSRIDVTNTCR